MKFRFSRRLHLETPDIERAVEFYQKVVGLELMARTNEGAQFKAEDTLLHVHRGDAEAPIFEIIAANAERAREHLESEACQVVRWEGAGGRCYMRDPFGFIFNVREDPEALEKGEPGPPESSREQAEFWGQKGPAFTAATRGPAESNERAGR